MSDLIHVFLFTLLGAIAIVIVRMRDLFGAAMLLGIFSLISASLFTVMDAVDVAFTEAAVGAGISTVVILGTLALTESQEDPRYSKRRPIALVVVVVTGLVLFYGTLDMPAYGDPSAPVHQHPIAQRYIEVSPDEIGVPNIVTSVLASYRGYDTWGETTVVLTAAVGVLLLLGGARKRGLFQRREDTDASADAGQGEDAA